MGCYAPHHHRRYPEIAHLDGYGWQIYFLALLSASAGGGGGIAGVGGAAGIEKLRQRIGRLLGLLCAAAMMVMALLHARSRLSGVLAGARRGIGLLLLLKLLLLWSWSQQISPAVFPPTVDQMFSHA